MSEELLIPVASSLSLAQASAVLDATLAAGRSVSLLPLTVVVLDAGGNLVAMKREDGSGIFRFEIARGKAGAALGMGMSGRTIRDRLAQRVGFQAAAAMASGGEFVPVPGGVLILDAQRQAVGAVGVSGDASDKDEYAAVEGVKAAGLTPDPAEASDDWANAAL